MADENAELTITPEEVNLVRGIARMLFQKRGNPEQVHLTLDQLMALLGGAVVRAREGREKAATQQARHWGTRGR